MDFHEFQEKMTQYLSDELSFKDFIDILVKNKMLYRILSNDKRTLAYKVFLKASQNASDIQYLIDKIKEDSTELSLYHLNYFMYFFDLFEYAIKNNHFEFREFVDACKRSQCLWTVFNASKSFLDFVKRKNIITHEDFKYLIENLSNSSDVQHLFDNPHLLKILFESNALNVETFPTFLKKLQSLDWLDLMFKLDTTLKLPKDLCARFESFFDDSQLFQEMLNSLFQSSECSRSRRELFFSQRELSYNAISSSSLMKKAFVEGHITRKHLQSLLYDDEKNLSYKRSLSLLGHPSFICESLKLNLITDSEFEKLLNLLPTAHEVATFFRIHQNTLKTFLVSQQKLLQKSTLDHFDLLLKDDYQKSRQFASCYLKNTYDCVQESIKDSKLKACLEQNLNMHKLGVLNFTQFDDFEKIELFQLCSDSENIQFKLKEIVTYNLESTFETLESLKMHLNKKDKKLSLTI